MSVDKAAVKDALRSGGDEYEYRDEICNIGGDRAREGTVYVQHFIVQRDSRGQGIATDLLDCLEEVLIEDGIYGLKIEMGSTECYSREELEEERDSRGDPNWQDPTYEFLAENGFRNLEYRETHQWGLCVAGQKQL